MMMRGCSPSVSASASASASTSGGFRKTTTTMTPRRHTVASAASAASAFGGGVPGGDAAAAADDDDDAEEVSTSYRFVVVGLIALALLLCNADRVIMSVAGVPLAALNGWGAKSIGLVQSSFLWGYMLTPLLGGVLADKYGGKAVLGGGQGCLFLLLFTPHPTVN